jgi:PAS domain S-box-containing protein
MVRTRRTGLEHCEHEREAVTSTAAEDARELAAARNADARLHAERGARAYCALAAVLFLATLPLDDVRFAEPHPSLVRIRLIGVTLCLLLLAVLRTRTGRRHPWAVGLGAVLVAGGVVDAMVFATGGQSSPANASMLLVLLGVAFLLPWPAEWSTFACLLVVAGYVASAIVAEPDPFGGRFAEILVVMAVTSALAAVVAALRERRRAQSFADGWALARAHRETRATAERYRSVLDTAGSAIVVLTPQGNIAELNHEAERLLGWPREDALGRELLALCVPSETHDRMCAELARVLGGEPIRARDVRLRTRDGSERTLAWNASPLAGDDGRPAGVVVCAQDFTARKRTEEALRDSEARLRAVVANAPIVLFGFDANGVITLTEGQGLARLGLAPGETVGRTLTEVAAVFPDYEPRTGNHFARALAGESVTWVGRIGPATFEYRLTPVLDEGRVTGVIGVAIDLTDRAHAEQARLALERRLLEAQKLESLGVMAGGIAHDFNNLLLTVLGNVAEAREDVAPGSALHDQLAGIETAARRGSDLTRQLLASTGKESVVLQPVDLNDLIRELEQLLRKSRPKSVLVRYALDPALPAIDADATQVRQVVMNLLINAAEAVGARGGSVDVRTGTAVVDEASRARLQHAPDFTAGPQVVIEVSDSGCGIDADTMKRMFDPFFSTKLAGRGLGLSTVLGVVRGHGGALDVTSEPGRGTTFRVFLPRRRVMRAEAEAAPAPAPVSDRRTVLLVDDEDDVRTITAHMLERLGCSVLQATDGREGVDVYRTRVQTIDAVLLDLTLPRLNGEQAFREIRTIRPDARVILMSGYNDEPTTRRLTQLGLSAFLRKPFSVADLRSTIGKALG